MGTVINFRGRAPFVAAHAVGRGPQLQLELNGCLVKVHTLAEASATCKAHQLAGEIVDDGETVATINPQGVIRDLDQKVVSCEPTTMGLDPRL